MVRTLCALLIFLVLMPLSLAAPAMAQNGDQAGLPFLSPLFSDNMVLQRDHVDPVWGWTKPGAEVKVAIAGQSVAATAGPDGKWVAEIGPFPAGGPYTMEIAGPEHVRLTNVLIGDVWLCSGQSNMEVSVAMMKNGPAEVAAADHPDIRLFLVERAWGSTPQETLHHGESWKVCSPRTITQGGWNGFSAVAYYYGRELQAKTHVPIGLIQSCWSATPAESWASEQVLAALPGYSDVNQRLAGLATLRQTIAKEQEAWCDSHDPSRAASSAARYSDSRWPRLGLPASWSQYGSLKSYTGIVWLRRSFDLPISAVGHDAVLRLGPVAESDTVWVNGILVGAGAGRAAPRAYTVPASALVAGPNEIAIRVLNLEESVGGILGEPKDMEVDTGNGLAIPLAGEWRYRQTDNINRLAEGRPVWGEEYQASQVPAALYNGMIAPLIPYGIAGAIWYQGESNTPRAGQYQALLTAMIADWRKSWGEGDFPFYIAQIASFADSNPERAGHWAALREAQASTAATVPNSGMAVTIDIGDSKNIHPKDKQDVGRRLALLALAGYYHQDVAASGPAFKAMTQEGRGIRLLFDHTDGGLRATAKRVSGFTIAGSDRKFYPANAKIEGETVFVSSPKVKSPVAVRYGWADDPACDLYNGPGLPAAPFRTDNWPL